MKITNQQVIDSLKALPVLDGCKLTVKGAFAMRKNRALLIAETKEINETHAEIFKRHFGDIPHADDKHPNWAEFRKDDGELMAVEVAIVPHKIMLADILESAPGLIQALGALDWVIEDSG